MAANEYAVLRRFNRAWTQRVGALDDSFLGTGRSLAPSRVLFEIGPAGVGVRELRQRLGLDSGYLSRLVRQLEGEGLVTTVPDPDDRRRRLLTLTPAGRRAWDVLEERSERLASELVAPLSPGQRRRLDEALSAAERLIRAATVSLDLVDPTSRPALEAVSRYFAELDRRFPGGFDPGDALTSDAPAYRPPTGAFVLATADGDPVACGAVQSIDSATGEIKRMWVDDRWRGCGLGGRMLRRLEEESRALGHEHVRLDTNSVLTEAIAMYEAAGYRPIQRYNDNPYARRWFEKDLGR
jgi:DNA-binding MarR family transcriptional regulator